MTANSAQMPPDYRATPTDFRNVRIRDENVVGVPSVFMVDVRTVWILFLASGVAGGEIAADSKSAPSGKNQAIGDAGIHADSAIDTDSAAGFPSIAEVDGSSQLAACPALPPTAGTSCSGQPTICEYGGDPDYVCTAHAICVPVNDAPGAPDAGLVWYWQPAPDHNDLCPTIVSNCSIEEGAPCNSGVINTPNGWCTRSDGSECMCDVDGTLACSHLPGKTSCELPRPRVGSPCQGKPIECDYLPEMWMKCEDGYWTGDEFGD